MLGSLRGTRLAAALASVLMLFVTVADRGRRRSVTGARA